MTTDHDASRHDHILERSRLEVEINERKYRVEWDFLHSECLLRLIPLDTQEIPVTPSHTT